MSLIKLVDEVRDVCNSINALRARHKIRNRQPLPEVKLVGSRFWYLRNMPDMVEIIKDECNVKKVTIIGDKL